MSIGLYTEAMLFFVTKLSPTTLIILGIPWLQKHKPCPSFKKLKIRFNLDYYSRHCLPWGITDSSRDALYGYSVLLSLVPRTIYKALTVKDVPNKGEPMQL
jgi:hypothetical protein